MRSEVKMQCGELEWEGETEKQGGEQSAKLSAISVIGFQACSVRLPEGSV